MTAPVVHLVGAGPGGPGSLTRRAARWLASADVVVLDRPSLDAVADLAPAAAERVHVGLVRGGSGAWPTAEVVALLADRARAGRSVVRLKGGDPFLCSRGGEEALALAGLGVDVQVAPGVTSATAAAAASGLYRGPAVTVVSGNHDPEGPEVDWRAVGRVADGRGAVVVLTGRAHQRQIADGLLAAGRPSGWPAAVVHGAGRTDQEVVPVALAEVGTTRLPPPAALVVGGDPVPEVPGGGRAHP